MVLNKPLTDPVRFLTGKSQENVGGSTTAWFVNVETVMSRKASSHLGQKYHRGIALEVIPLAYMPILSKVQKLFGGSVELRMAKNKAVRGSF